MYVRVVRFTGATAERVDNLVSRIEQAGGPPEGIPTTGLQLLFDEKQQSALVLQFFASAEDMQEGDRAFGAMEPTETPGTRASVDMCELKLERHVG